MTDAEPPTRCQHCTMLNLERPGRPHRTPEECIAALRSELTVVDAMLAERGAEINRLGRRVAELERQVAITGEGAFKRGEEPDHECG